MISLSSGVHTGTYLLERTEQIIKCLRIHVYLCPLYFKENEKFRVNDFDQNRIDLADQSGNTYSRFS